MQKTVTSPSPKVTVPRLFVLELNAGCIHLMNTDGSDHTTIVTGCHLPDGIVVDVEAGHIYWTNMGIPNLNDGSVERADIDGKNRKTVIAKGDTHTPKQIVLDKKGGKLYWCDREGMRVMRCNLDGSQLETLIEAGRGEADEPRAPLQAGATIGSVALRESLNVIMAGRQASVDPGRLILTTGAQQALDLLSRVTLDPGDIVFVERPTYAMAPQTFDLSQADVRGLNVGRWRHRRRTSRSGYRSRPTLGSDTNAHLDNSDLFQPGWPDDSCRAAPRACGAGCAKPNHNR